jgi:hypothetical protein
MSAETEELIQICEALPKSIAEVPDFASREIGRPQGVSNVLEEPGPSLVSIEEARGYENVWSVRVNEQYRAVGA